MTVDPGKVAALIGEIAEDIIAPKFRNLPKEAVRTKSGPNDLVTEVDEMAERALEKALRGVDPGAYFIGEESVAREPSRADALGGPGAFWIVDPLDGTRNFVRGVPEFGSIVAYVRDGEILMGWIYGVPDKAFAIAVKGEGASWAGAPIEIKQAPDRLRGLRSLSWLSESEQTRLRAVLSKDFDTKNGHCSAYSYLLLARGLVDFKISSRIHPWDHLAGALLLSELGGRAAFLGSGEEYGPRPPLDRALLAVAPRRDWDDLAAALRR